MSGSFLSKRNFVIAFGAILVVMVVIVGVAVGVGHPSVPSDDVAVIDDSSINVPGLVQGGKISKTNFDRFLAQTAKSSGLQTVPQPSDPQYKQLKDTAMQSALQLAWIFGEANKEGLSITDTQVQQALTQLKAQSGIKTQAQFQKALQQSGLTEQDVLVRARRQVIVNTITDRVQGNVSQPSSGDVQKFYDANKSQYKVPAKRTIRIVQNNDAHQIDLAYQALRTDDSAANWKKVAAQYSTDTVSKSKGGLRTDVVPGSFQQPLDDDIFKAPTGQIQGPVHTTSNNYVFEVISATPGRSLGLDDTTSGAAATGQQQQQTIRQLIGSQLKQQLQNDALNSFGQDFNDYWTNQTQCASGYVVQGCDNFNGGGPACDPSKLASQPGQPNAGCPAPVFASCQEASAATGGQSGQLQCTGVGPGGPPPAPGSYRPFLDWSQSPRPPQGPHPPGAGVTSGGGLPPGIQGLTGGP